MNLIKLKYFVAVAEYKSFTKAAQKFHIAQSAISQQIKSLEQELGFQLIERPSNGFSLTEAGRILLEDSYKLLNDFAFTMDKCRSIASNYSGHLTLGIVGWDENIYFKKLLSVFKQHYPNIDLHFKRVAFNAIEEDLLNREYDCTLTFPYDLIDKKRIETLVMFQSPAKALVSKQNDLASKNSVKRSELASECCIVFNHYQMEKSKGHLMSIFEKEELSPRDIRYVSDRQIMDILVGMNQGIAIVPDIWSGYPELGIVKMPIEGDVHLIDFSLIFNKEIENKAMAYFLEIARREIDSTGIRL